MSPNDRADNARIAMTTATAEHIMSKAEYRREIRACWAAFERLMYELSQDAHAARRGEPRKHGAERPDDWHLTRWAPGQGDMDRMLDRLATDCRRHRRAGGGPPSSAWRMTVEEDGMLMVLRFVAGAEPGPWLPIADPGVTEWFTYGNAIGAVLGDRRPAEWIERVRALDKQPRYSR
jgi:hypothetical protein